MRRRANSDAGHPLLSRTASGLVGERHGRARRMIDTGRSRNGLCLFRVNDMGKQAWATDNGRGSGKSPLASGGQKRRHRDGCRSRIPGTHRPVAGLRLLPLPLVGHWCITQFVEGCHPDLHIVAATRGGSPRGQRPKSHHRQREGECSRTRSGNDHETEQQARAENRPATAVIARVITGD